MNDSRQSLYSRLVSLTFRHCVRLLWRMLLYCSVLALLFVILMYDWEGHLSIIAVSFLIVLMAGMVTDGVFKVMRNRNKGMCMLLLPASNRDKYFALLTCALALSFLASSFAIFLTDLLLAGSDYFRHLQVGTSGSLHALVFGQTVAASFFSIAVGLWGVSVSVLGSVTGRSTGIVVIEIMFGSFFIMMVDDYSTLMSCFVAILLVVDVFNLYIGYRYFCYFQLGGRQR